MTMDAQRAAVAAYFQAIDHLQPDELGGSAEDKAQEIVTALIKGDASGLDGLIRQSEAAKQRLAAIVPPAPCARFHQECQANLDESLGMLRSIKQSISASDPKALEGLTQSIYALRARAEAMQREEKDLGQRYGLSK